MLYLIGLGLNFDGISDYGLACIRRCKKVYLENYTVDFPYSVKKLEEVIKKKIILADRKFVESLEIVDRAKKLDIALLVYGSPLTATTHITLLNECKNSRIKCKIIHSASILDAISETGLQIYKFGRIASIPTPKENYNPTSFLEIIKENKKSGSHSLVLVDIGLNLDSALKVLAPVIDTKEKIVVCSRLGTKDSKIFYKNLIELEEYENIKKPYCIIIPSKLHFLEKEVLENV